MGGGIEHLTVLIIEKPDWDLGFQKCGKLHWMLPQLHKLYPCQVKQVVQVSVVLS